VFRKKHKKSHHFTIGPAFQPVGTRTVPLIVVPTFSGAEQLFMGHNAFGEAPVPGDALVASSLSLQSISAVG
jgi:hypothetical protein